jgi:hypothetical protein
LAIANHFTSLPGPRVERTRRHDLIEIIAIAGCAVIGNADTREEVEAHGYAKADPLKRFLKLANGTPPHDTLRGTRERQCAVNAHARVVHQRVDRPEVFPELLD